MTEPTRFTSVRFRNFKAFANFSVALQPMNMLVGPNNSGKSTIIGAFRALAAGIQRARARNPEWIRHPDGDRLAHRVPEESIPISLENVHTDYSDEDSSVTFRLSSGRELTLSFPATGGCFLLTDVPARSVSDFKRIFPVTVGVVPVLGPVEHDEAIVEEQTVKRGLATHRASRHFRNYWWRNQEGFESFAAQVRDTWPGMEIQLPDQPDPFQPTLAMFCLEDRVTRELYWSGFGFQVWCQILTHLVRERAATILVIDEPEIYLHPDLQRQLLSILRDAGPDILLATHSPELVTEAEPTDILLVDKARQSAKRINDVKGMQAALEALGSVQNLTLTQLARTRRVLFTEGADFKVIRRFAKRMGLTQLATGADLAVQQLGGFSVDRVKAFCHAIRESVALPVLFAVILDRDFRCDEEVNRISAELRRELAIVHIHRRKEIENYLLVPSVLDRAIAKALAEHRRRTGTDTVIPEPASSLLERITETMRQGVLARYLSQRSAYLRGTGLDAATINEQTINSFDTEWRDPEFRLRIVPGKDTLARLNAELQTRYGISLTSTAIVDCFTSEEIPVDLRQVLRDLDKFRREDPSVAARV